MSSSNDQIYRKLQREIDQRMPIGFPRSKSGLDIKVLKQLFTPEEAEIATHLSALPEHVDKIHKRSSRHGMKITRAQLKEKLKDMYMRGLIMGGALFGKSTDHYSLAQLAVGIYEFQIDKQDKEFAQNMEKYLMETFYKELHRNDRPNQMRTIPVEKSLTPEHHVITYDNIRKIIDNVKGKIVVTDCVCKQSKDLMEEPCRVSDVRNCCILFDNSANHAIETSVPSAKEVSKSELYEMLDKFQKAGLVLQPENAKKPLFICVCCGCCCGILTSLKKFPKPAEYASFNFQAVVNDSSCNGCKTCLKRCQMDAITMIDDKTMVDHDRCIGCGVCVTTCGMKAIILIRTEKTQIPAKTHDSLYYQIMMKKKGIIGSLGLVGKIFLGKKL